ncbi:MAG TPA: hypothetical protein VHN14_13910 [Kofleriaceae bacterium]|jgi:hypothetical protein|nr:hypothetical protein [Kofleriaceae bacterium]
MTSHVHSSLERQGLDPQPRQLGATQPGLDGNEQERVIAATGSGASIGYGEERVDLEAYEEVDGPPIKSFVWHREDALEQPACWGSWRAA